MGTGKPHCSRWPWVLAIAILGALIPFASFHAAVFVLVRVPATPTAAGTPSPADDSTDVETTASLSWTAGTNTATHKVYFGTSNPPSTLVATQSGTTYDPAGVGASTTYYWRVDEVGETVTTEGSVWSFTTAAEEAPEEVNRVLTAGDHWDGATAQPAAQGSAASNWYDCNCMARWDVVQYQEVNDTLNVGVVAFACSDINYVSFSDNNGPWTNIYTMAANPDTANGSSYGRPTDGIVEYYATVTAANHAASGLAEIRAIAYPKIGKPRILNSLYLWIDKGDLPHKYVWVDATDGNDLTGQIYTDKNQASPACYKTVYEALTAINGSSDSAPGDEDCNYATAYVRAGTYTLGSPAAFSHRIDSHRHWVTIQNAPGTAEGEPNFVKTATESFQMYRTSMLHYKGLAFYRENPSQEGTEGYYIGSDCTGLWVDHCYVHGDTSDDDADHASGLMNSTEQWGGVTDTTVAHCGEVKMTHIEVARNVDCNDISGDVFQNAHNIINCRARNMNGVIAHPDALQWANVYQNERMDNAIVYGYEAFDNFRYSQVMMTRIGESDTVTTGTARDIAFVDYVALAVDYIGAWVTNTDNMLWLRVAVIGDSDGGALLLEDETLSGKEQSNDITHFRMEDCCFERIDDLMDGNPGTNASNVFSGNYFINTTGLPNSPAGVAWGDDYESGALSVPCAIPGNPGYTVSTYNPTVITKP